MEEKKSLVKAVLKGLISSAVLTIVLLISLAIVMIVVDISSMVYSVIFLVINVLSLSIGAIIAARNKGEKGFITGGVIGLCYYLVLLGCTAIITKENVFNLNALYMLLGSTLAGSASGILGINL